MGALEARLHDINVRLAASSVEVEALARLLRRREAILETADEVRERMDAATERVQGVEEEIERSPRLFHFALHRRRQEAFLEPGQKAGFVAAGMYLVLEHELGALDEELNDLEAQARRLKGGEVRHRMLVEWRDEILMSLGPGRFTAAEQSLERVSASVEVASRAEDLRVIEEAQSVAARARADLAKAAADLEKEGTLEKDDLAVVADIIPEGTRHFRLREVKRRVEQATLRLGFTADELRGVKGLTVAVRHPYFAMEAFLGALFDDLQAGRAPVEAQAALEEAEDYLNLVESALEGACEDARGKLEAARSAESEQVESAVRQLRPSPIRLKARYSAFDEVPLRR